MAGTRWRWRWRSMLRLRRMRSARVCRSADWVVHVLDDEVLRDWGHGEGIGVELRVEGGLLVQGDGEGEVVERALDDDLRREVDVAEFLVGAVGGLGLDLAVGVVDVLLVGQQGGAADVNDGQGP